MQRPLEISFREVEHTKELDDMIRDEVKKLERDLFSSKQCFK